MQRATVGAEKPDVKDVRTGAGGAELAVERSQVVKMQTAGEIGGPSPRVSFTVAFKAGEQVLAGFDSLIESNPAADRDDDGYGVTQQFVAQAVRHRRGPGRLDSSV